MPVTIDRVEDGLPISVIVPLSLHRKDFFDNYVLPMIEANNPREIVIVTGEGSAPRQRNKGWSKATEEFVFYCDDDCLLPANYLQTLYDAIKNHEWAYAYSGYIGIVLNKDTQPPHNFLMPSHNYNYGHLTMGNYISSMALVHRELMLPFDENLKRLQDWDVWLRMGQAQRHGTFVRDITFFAFFLDAGQTSNNNISYEEAVAVVKKKHNLT